MLKFTNTLLCGLRETHRRLLDCAICALREEFREWYTLLAAEKRFEPHGEEDVEDGDPLWPKAASILNLLKVIDDVLVEALDPVDSDDLPDCEDVAFLPKTETGFQINEKAEALYVECRAGGDGELKWNLTAALSDLNEEVDDFFGRIVPSFYARRDHIVHPADRDDYILFEASRKVKHMIYHVECDILELELSQ